MSHRLRPGEAKADRYDGKPIVKVPVVMARSDVIMNGSLIPQEELIPETWDGVPVTFGHPHDGQGFVSANTPDNLSDWSIGRIFNSRIDGLALKGEAWIDVTKARQIAPGFIETLLSSKSEVPINVSTGYFSRDEEQQGELNGRTYSLINRDVKPNHLAILVDEEGACSWEDGCGIRSNTRRTKVKDVKLNKRQQTALDTLRAAIKGGAVNKSSLMVSLFANERGQDDDRRQIMADLISKDESPFTPDDEQSLMMMSESALRRMRDDYLAAQDEPLPEEEKPADEDEEKEEEPKVEEDGDEEKKPDEETPAEEEKEEDEEKVMKSNAALPKTHGELTAVINSVVAAAVKKLARPAPRLDVKALAKELRASMLSAEDRAALALAANQVKVRRESLIDKITTNSAITEEAARAMDDKTLELVANGLYAQPSYAGRQTLIQSDEEETDPAIAAMTAHLNIRDELKEARDKRRTRVA